MPQPQCPYQGSGISGQDCGSDHTWQDADRISLGYSSVSLAAYWTVAMNTGHAMMLKVLIQALHACGYR
ncbi:hypothetical protein, partial [Klebsiella pneumoniae]|uniref:hypothetical protein n=1 Tax=Klebsiella pneumoniae TaxID=573 RepID=UPI00197ADC20